MARVKVHFKKVHQDSQDYGSDDQHMISRVYFDVEVAGRIHSGLHVNVKQTVGADFERDPLEVDAPAPDAGAKPYAGPFNPGAFRREVETYYREQVGRMGRSVHIAGATSVRMMGNRFVSPKTVEFEATQSPGPW